MNKAVFLDRDGTINVDTGYICNPDDLVFIRGSKKAVKLLKENEYLVYVMTNQSGVGRGYFSIEKMHAVNDRLAAEFEKEGIVIDGIFACPHRPDEECKCRKPKPDVVFETAEKNNVDLRKSFFVGDKDIDIETGKNAGCRTVLIVGDADIIEKKEKWPKPDYVSKNLLEAVKWIIKSQK
jgi:histidinol-phosphate phosphatase family protein